jgi:hypothetical protein
MPDPPPAPPAPTVAEVCEQLCVRADQICTADGARRCRGACVAYVRASTGCEDQTKAALECQVRAEASDICSHVAASSCAREFRVLRACQRGEPPPETQLGTAGDVPAAWQKIVDEELGFSLSLPPDAALDTAAKRRTWRAEEGGTSYVVARLPDPPAKITDAALLRMVIDYVGVTCQRNIRLHGRFESDGIVGVRYDSGCNDKSQWHGMLRIRGGQALSIGWHAPAGVQGVLDPFFFSFEYAKSQP